jgi:hypothetical protein
VSDEEVRIRIRERRWLFPVLFFVLFGVLFPAVPAVGLVAGGLALAGGQISAGGFDLAVAATLAVPAFLGAREAWSGLRPQPDGVLVISPTGVQAIGQRRPAVIPWERISDVRVRPYGLLRRQRLVVRAIADVDDAFHALTGTPPGRPYAVYAIRMSALVTDRLRLADAMSRCSRGRCALR